MSDRPAPVGACGRAELLWAFRAGGAPLLARTADLLGFEERPIDEESSRSGADSGTGNDLSQTPQSPSEPPEIVSAKIRDAQFWRLESYEPVAQQAPESEPERAVAVTPRGWTNRPLARPAIHVLAPWPELRRRLRPQLTELREGPEPDLERLVGRIGCGLLLERLPRLRQRRLGPALQLVFDRSERLVPFWSDQDQVAGELARLLAAEALTRAVFHEGLTEPRLLDQAQAGYRPPAAGGVVLVLGDLGSLAATGATDLWLRIGRRIAANGCRPVALVPCRRSRVPEALRRLWCILPWERPPGIAEVAARALGEQPDDLDVRRGRARRLLALLAPAVRIEPGLLRAVRLCLADPVFDAAVEADCWQGPAVASTHSEAATLNPRAVADLRTAFATETLAVRRRVLALLRTWRGHLPKEIWYEEILNLAPDSGAVLLDSQELEQDLEDARRFFGHLCAELTPDPTADTAAGAWVRRMSARATAIWRDEVIGTSLVKLDWAMHRHRPDYRPPIPIDPAALPAPGVSVRRIALSQVGSGLSFHGPGADRSLPGSPLAIMETSNRLVDVTSSGRGSQDPAFWESGEPPRWAHAWGWDQSGAWVDFAVAGSDGWTVTQRMRWIDLGTFPMGSPKDESERYSDEGPQRRVRIERGFWLFDTAVSQALWEAVKGDKPSYVKGLDRPVEQVSWEDCQDFIARVNVLKPGLALALPSEAQWEYACRAGTDTPFSFGANITPEQVNYDGDAPYAGAERGLSRGETVPVGSLPANAWGLYEMHGNVREWVQDTWHDNYEGAPTDESAWESTEAGAARVMRGGSWYDLAGRCRSAFRGRYQPGFRDDYFGFRCARVQAREPGGLEEGAARTAGENVSTSPWFRLDTVASKTVQLPHTNEIQIFTDRQRLTLRRATKPAWASALGRDRFGLWSEIAVERGEGAPAIQRLRWIPPGRFTMGSPKDEPGRWAAEGPQHPVTFIHGFWLFDTPCTQALWEAVMGQNPSEFKTQDRPVEGVSWSDAQRFLEKLNSRLRDADDSGGAFVFPSEAQWEYACRAGTETALYTGPIEILGANNAPALDHIAWYGGNSGVGFELEDGADSSGWSEMQYPGGKAGTHPVKGKQPNPWGLYDMLGNVQEWTWDVWHDSYKDAPSDGSAWQSTKTGADRVIRGGSWSNDAGGCRSAYRSGGQPGGRGSGVGFRCARVQES